MKKKDFKVIDLVYIGVGAALIAVCAFATVPIGPVPFTLQTLGVCLTAGLLGRRGGIPAVLVYILLGAVGVPVFSGFKGGIGVLFGATGGYIIGFLFTALLVGTVADKTKGKLWQLLLGMTGGVLLCYVFGTAWFAAVFAHNGDPRSLGGILSVCVVPFLLPDAVKIVLAAVLTNRLKTVIVKPKKG
ncbi:MAG: biotin transporter BioY [Eubacterium sp.]|nr:biotin transporter BioY [Eubacterium sp.]